MADVQSSDVRNLGTVSVDNSHCQPLFGFFQFGGSSEVFVFLDEVAGLGEFVLVGEQAGAVEVDVGEVQWHRASLGRSVGLRPGSPPVRVAGNREAAVAVVRLRNVPTARQTMTRSAGLWEHRLFVPGGP